jgi:hypothetical protein
MSLEMVNSLFNKQSNDNTEKLLAKLNNNIEKLIDVTPQPFIFLKTGDVSSNAADGVVLAAGQRVPDGFRATIKDFNLVFSTAAGTIQVKIFDRSNNVVMELLQDITDDTNGIGESVLDEGEKLVVTGQSAGAGTFKAFCTGSLQRFRL